MKKYIVSVVALAMAVSVAVAEESADGFETSLNLGLSLTDGNSETHAVNASLVTEGEKEGLGSVIASVEANYGESKIDGKDETTAENVKAGVNVKKTVTPRTFASFDVSALYDDVAGIDYRVTLGPGLGVYLLKSKKHELSVEAGPSYVWEKLEGEKDNYLALRFAERLACQILPNAKLVQTLEYVPEASEFGNYQLTGVVGVEAAMSERLNLRVVLQDQYKSRPAEGKDRNDVSVIAGIGLSL